MAIRIFFKHLFTSIRKRPMQPILLILVIALSVAVCVAAFHVRIFLIEESNLTIKAQTGNADFTVTFSSDSSMRFLFEDEISATLDDDDAVVCGSFTVPMYYGEDEAFYYGVASNFTTVSDIFDIDFVEYMPFNKSQVSSSIFISKKFADETGTKLGDEITLKVLSMTKTFKVVGISKNYLLGEYSAMIDISTLVGMIARDSLFVSLIGDDFVPSTKVFVSVDGNVDEAIAKINNEYENVIVSKVTTNSVLEESTKAIVMIIIMLAVVFAFAVIYVCFSVITAQRQSENALFFAAGAKGYMLNLLSIAEMFIYWLIGGLIGVGISYPVAEVFIAIGNFTYIVAYVETWTIFASLAITLLAAEGSMCTFMLIAFLRKRKIKKAIAQKNNVENADTKKAKSIKTDDSMKWISIVLAVLSVVLICLGIIDNVNTKTIFSIGGIFVLIVSVFIGARYAFPKVAGKFSKLKKLPVALRYAVKNASRVESLANTASVVALLILVMGSIGLVLAFSIKSVEHDTNYLVGEYMVQNITDSGLAELKASSEIKAVYGVFSDYGIDPDENRYTVISASDPAGLSKHLGITELPTGNNVLLCEECAMAHGYKMGEEFKMTISGVECNFVYAGNVRIGGNVLIINYEDMGFSPTFYEVIGKDGMTGDDVKQNIANTLMFESAVIIPTTAMTQHFSEIADRYTTCIELITVFLLIFSLIGIVDSIVSSYRSRKAEFACYMSAGMNKSMIRKMKCFEVLFAVAFAFIIAIVAYVFAFGDIHQIIRSFTENMFYVFQ